MSLLLWVRECVKFRATPAVSMAIFSGRLLSRTDGHAFQGEQ
ncbi:hypothetical protein GQ600_2029 [Phytophthora cactorum]|nr:hypothetical protein GQ600_2029 [Phytophthora cactorum]